MLAHTALVHEHVSDMLHAVKHQPIAPALRDVERATISREPASQRMLRRRVEATRYGLRFPEAKRRDMDLRSLYVAQEIEVPDPVEWLDPPSFVLAESTHLGQ